MTSQEIKAAQTGPEDSEAYWLQELAYQMAVLNETDAQAGERK